MIHVQGKLPRKLYLAYSGGVDSAAALDFLVKNHDVTLAFVNHQNPIADTEERHAVAASNKYNIPLVKYYITSVRPADQSKEEFWRTERYKFFNSLDGDVITCHHLDDCVETYLWNMCNGKDYTIPYRNKNVIRPFRLTRKQEFMDWCIRKEVGWYQDLSNLDPDFATRNYIRSVLMPSVLRVNPGIHTTIRNKLLQEKI